MKIWPFNFFGPGNPERHLGIFLEDKKVLIDHHSWQCQQWSNSILLLYIILWKLVSYLQVDLY